MIMIIIILLFCGASHVFVRMWNKYHSNTSLPYHLNFKF